MQYPRNSCKQIASNAYAASVKSHLQQKITLKNYIQNTNHIILEITIEKREFTGFLEGKRTPTDYSIW